ncbi:hypothetical protein D3C81_1813460 [compost metagenome]
MQGGAVGPIEIGLMNQCALVYDQHAGGVRRLPGGYRSVQGGEAGRVQAVGSGACHRPAIVGRGRRRSCGGGERRHDQGGEQGEADQV